MRYGDLKSMEQYGTLFSQDAEDGSRINNRDTGIFSMRDTTEACLTTPIRYDQAFPSRHFKPHFSV